MGANWLIYSSKKTDEKFLEKRDHGRGFRQSGYLVDMCVPSVGSEEFHSRESGAA